MRRGRRLFPSRWWFHLPIRQKGMVVVAIPLLALAAMVVLRIPFDRQQQRATAEREQADTTRQLTKILRAELLDVETAVRGYVLTADRTFLEPFDAVRDSLSSRLEPLDAETARLVRLELALASELAGLVERGATPHVPEVQQGIRQAKTTMDAIRVRLGTVEAQHAARAAEIDAELKRLRQLLSLIILITVSAGLGGAVVAGWLFATGIAARVTALERNAERLADGERLRFETSRGTDEIGSLDRALRRAALLLRTRERELRTVNKQLVHTVHEQVLLNRELEAFSYSVSHDLRAPLRSIDGFAQALREDWGDRLDEAGQDHLARVRNAAQRMGRLIDDLLKLSKLTRAQVQRVDVDLSRLAEEVIAELSDRNPTRSVVWQIEDGLQAWCDPSLARIALENLLGNAWKFTSKTADARISFQATPGTEPTLFVIRDNGAGFDMKYVDKLFAPFQRLHADRDFPGSGIGLATTQRIVRKHGGAIRTDSAVGAGAAFFFTLEAAVDAAAVA